MRSHVCGPFYDLEAHAGNCPGAAPPAPVDPPCSTPDMRAKADRLMGDMAEGLGLIPGYPGRGWALPFVKLLILITEELWGPGEVKVNDG